MRIHVLGAGFLIEVGPSPEAVYFLRHPEGMFDEHPHDSLQHDPDLFVRELGREVSGLHLFESSADRRGGRKGFMKLPLLVPLLATSAGAVRRP